MYVICFGLKPANKICYILFDFLTRSTKTYDSHSDFESDESDDEDNLSNTLMLTGPCGCGTTAAVYACAKQMDFKVCYIVVNENALNPSLIVWEPLDILNPSA